MDCVVLSKQQIKSLEKINKYLEEANKEFSKLPMNVSISICGFHNESHSLNHCLRWGSQAVEEILKELNINKRDCGTCSEINRCDGKLDGELCEFYNRETK